MTMHNTQKTGLTIILSALTLVSCINREEINDRLDKIEARIAAVETIAAEVNTNATAASMLLKENIYITGIEPKGNDGYDIMFGDGTSCSIWFGTDKNGTVPTIGIDENGNWMMSVDGGKTYETISGAANALNEAGPTPEIRIDSDHMWSVSLDGGKTWKKITDQDGNTISAIPEDWDSSSTDMFFSSVEYRTGDTVLKIILADGRTLRLPVDTGFSISISGYKEKASIMLGEPVSYEVTLSKVAQAAFTVPEGWTARLTETELIITAPEEGEAGEYEIGITLVSTTGHIRRESLVFTLNQTEYNADACKEWNDFVAANEDNILLDFSYAGYRHGTEAPAGTAGYTTYDVTSYGAIPSDGKPDREAFLKVLKDIFGEPETKGRNIIFPHREKADAVIYFPEGEFILNSSEDDNRSIIIRSGNLMIKGAGEKETVLAMTAPMQPEDENILYSSPDMIQIKHLTSHDERMADVTGDSPKGSFGITLGSSTGLKAGDWVCLYLKSTDPSLIQEEVHPYTPDPAWSICTEGVEVIDYHQVKSVNGNTVTFHEPLMHKVGGNEGWELRRFPHYENVGIEDLTFKGNARADFKHHGDWTHDGAYKPISMMRLTDSWIRRVTFESTSEACSIINSSNVSAYQIHLTGNRGHSAIRAQASSRILIAATEDLTEDNSGNRGNFHGVGVSKQSIGTVLWRNKWGEDSCFESHASQPRATLIDCCTGGWNRGHQGGDSNQAPHHLADLTIWNFTAEKTGANAEGTFQWWNEDWWRFLPPVIIGFQSDGKVTFDEAQTAALTAEVKVKPESLYEAQLIKRLGYVPAWLYTLK